VKYHICKFGRVYSGHPYQGPTTCGLKAESDDYAHILQVADCMAHHNPVGWEVYDSETQEMIYSTVSASSVMRSS
jgi:hypothetical protein